MEEFKPNQYIELYHQGTNDYFPVRILSKTDSGYSVRVLNNGDINNVYNYQLIKYGFRNVLISDGMMKDLGFEKENLIYKLKDINVFECLLRDFNVSTDINSNNIYTIELLGYIILDESGLEKFQDDYNLSKNIIREKYTFFYHIDEIFNYLKEYDDLIFNYNKFDEIVLANNLVNKK